MYKVLVSFIRKKKPITSDKVERKSAEWKLPLNLTDKLLEAEVNHLNVFVL